MFSFHYKEEVDLLVNRGSISPMALKDSISTDIALQMIEERQQKLNILKAHTAQKIAQIAARERQHVFEKLRAKVRDAADYVSSSPLTGEIGKDMSDVAAVRREAEALFGKINPEDEKKEESTAPKSSQLNFLIGVQLGEAVLSHSQKPAQANPAHAGTYEAELLEP